MMESENKALERGALVGQAMATIRAVMDKGPSVANLDAAKAELIKLASHKEHFTFVDFPLPTDDAMECSYLIHEDDDGGYALYVNSGAPHQYYAPHDHGTAWAVIAGVEGRERHKLYLRRQNAADGESLIEKKGEVMVAAGEAATMQPDGIHEVNAMDGKPLLHLHLYARNFVAQGERWKYDLEQNTAELFFLDELGSITNAR
jgi:predicted metal-dependent enzyme (double-stranded beta helix superfamily)